MTSGHCAKYVLSAMLLLAVMKMSEGASWFEMERRESCPNFKIEATKCLDAFAQFATQSKPDIKDICGAYKDAKPCMEAILAKCKSDPNVAKSDITQQWKFLQSKNLDAYCTRY